MKDLLSLQNSTVGYGTKQVLNSIETTIIAGQVIAVVGPNGAGKSTLLHTVLGIQPALGGNITLEGKGIETWSDADRSAVVSALLTERISHGAWRVHEMVEMGVKTPALQEAEIEQWQDWLRLEELMPRQVSTLSSGEYQRVMLMRCLNQAAVLRVMDEPTANLDPGMSTLVMQKLRASIQQQGGSLLFSTHDLSTAITYADKLWLCDHGQLEVLSTKAPNLAQRFEEIFGQEGLKFNEKLMRFV